jgi:carbonic anhydrase
VSAPASSLAALEALREGNRRFVSGTRSRASLRTPSSASQRPFAIVLGCSDSRVPVEIVFDQGPGDLFVIRVAGNIVAPSQLGSVEFAAERFGTRLVVILGHTGCGAVQATLEELQRPTASHSRNLQFIVDRVRPAVDHVLASEPRPHPAELLREAVRANVRLAASALRRGSEYLRDLVVNEQLLIVGGEYALETGVVEFFDGVPGSALPREPPG